MVSLKRFVAVCLFLVLLAGCQTVRSKISQVTGLEQDKEKQIAALQVDFDQRIAAKTKELDDARLAEHNAVQAQITGGANSFYAQDLLWQTLASPGRTDFIWHDYTLEGWTALGHGLPDYNTMLKINERLKKELDATQTSLAQLAADHQIAMTESQKLSDVAKVATDRVAQVQKDKDVMEAEFNRQLAGLRGQLATLAQQNAALQQERADNAAAVQALKTKISIGCAVFALLCAAGAIYLPVGKGGLAALAAVTAIAGAAIWVITGEMVLYAVLACVLGLIGWAIYQHNASNKTVAALTGYLHEKGQLADTDLQAWLTKYVTKGGVTTTVPDPSVQAVIQQQLISTNKL